MVTARRLGSRTLGLRIRDARRAAGYELQTEFVDALNRQGGDKESSYTVSWLKGVESGWRAPRVVDLQHIARVARTTPGALLDGREPPNPNYELRELVKPFEGRINARQRKQLRDLLMEWARLNERGRDEDS